MKKDVAVHRVYSKLILVAYSAVSLSMLSLRNDSTIAFI